jgi:TRAP transporter TAXI family solute receptor
MFRKQGLGLVLVLALIISAVFGLESNGIAKTKSNVKRTRQTITVACGTSKGVGYITTTTLGAILTKVYPEYQIKPELTTGSAENVRLITQGVAQIGVCMADSALAAYKGNREFDKSTKGKIKFITGGYLTTITQIVPKNSTARELPDLKDKRLGVSKGVMSQFYFPLILNAYGLKKSDFKINVMSIGDILAGLKDGNLDYGIHVSSTPNNGILDLAMSNGINLLTMSDKICAKMIKKNPYFMRTIIPSNVYSTKNDSQTLATRNIYICAANADNQVVYDFVKTLIEHHDDIAMAHPQAGDFGGKNGENALKSQLIPIHPGALRYYKEVGIIK